MRRLCLEHFANIHGDQLAVRFRTVRALAHKLWEYRCLYAECGVPVVADHDNALADWYAAERALKSAPPFAERTPAMLTTQPAERFVTNLLRTHADGLYELVDRSQPGHVFTHVFVGTCYRGTHYTGVSSENGRYPPPIRRWECMERVTPAERYRLELLRSQVEPLHQAAAAIAAARGHVDHSDLRSSSSQ